MARYRVVQTGRSRASVTASRAKLAPTFVSGQLFLWELRANALVHGAISRCTNRAVARVCHRRNWPETNVGSELRSRCAARAALDLTGAENAMPGTLRPSHNSSRRESSHPCQREQPLEVGSSLLSQLLITGPPQRSHILRHFPHVLRQIRLAAVRNGCQIRRIGLDQ